MGDTRADGQDSSSGVKHTQLAIYHTLVCARAEADMVFPSWPSGTLTVAAVLILEVDTSYLYPSEVNWQSSQNTQILMLS